jgi:hypothetical protein
MESSMSSASPHFSRMVPISVKNGIASSRSLDKMPNTFSGSAFMKDDGNHPCETAK